ncbi:UDP-glucuronosyltransferase 2A2-like isoform X2 [Pelmatolapia mariae]|uniref:UDP-glucuronosyltransferase 2A2-like isoform X2 n=1 Tax=Pelmatolapia mariae TaxID=158779 RepID=UPI002FE51B5B
MDLRLSACILLVLCATWSANGGNVLVWYTEGSHWINMKLVLEKLVDRGHQVTVLVPSSSMYMNTNEPARFRYEPFNASFSLEAMEEFLEEFLRFSIYEIDYMNYLELYIRFIDIMKTDLQFSIQYLDGVVKSEVVMKKLKEGNYDLLLADPLYPGSDLVADILGIPLVFSLRFSVAYNWERHCGQMPAPPSFVPGAMSKLTDKMDFSERVWNFLFYALQDIVIDHTFWNVLDRYYSDVKALEGSHWINMKPVLETLVDRGHQVTVLVPSSSMYMNTNEPSRFRYEPFSVSFSLEAIEEFLEEYLRFSIYEIDYMSYWEIYIRFIDLMKTELQFSIQFLDGVVKSEVVMKKLKEGNYDLLLADPIYAGSDLVADILGIPLVFSLRFSIGNNWERHCGQMPTPPSFVPGAMSKLTDKMDFSERVWNFLFYALQDIVIDHTFWKVLDRYYSDVKGTPTSACELMSKADIWLIRTYWDFEFPRPFLPNFKYVGGIHCRPAKPLPEVLWRYRGEKPESLGANTKIYDWIPQNDLLGHPKARAFITHGGTNGIYEAIYHGVPIVGIPMFADQPDNMVHMKEKGAAVILNVNFMTAEDLRDAINTVINDKSYKENAMRLSSIHHDRPMSALEEAVFWIEFTLRNKGAKHLRVQAHELTWYQYHSLDVLGFFLTIVLLLIFIFIKTCSFCLHRCFVRKGKTKRKAE